LEEQENREPLRQLSQPPPSPYLPPPCVNAPEDEHPHQFIVVSHESGDEWRPIAEFEAASLLNLPTYSTLVNRPTIFPTVIPFKGFTPHLALVEPTDNWQANLFQIPSLYVCCRAGLTFPTPDLPLGFITYSFRHSIRETFSKHGSLVRNVFTHSLVVTEVYDFLDGRRIICYGKLSFNQGAIYIIDPAFHFEDIARQYPQLLRHCISPRIPADPCFFIRTFPDVSPL
jgi:hypothetical protein